MAILRCSECGKFVPYTGFISYTEYSGSYELEPNEPSFICIQCYEKSDKKLLNEISWVKPHIVKIDS